MKSLTRILPAVVALVMAYSLSALGADATFGQKTESSPGMQKDECVLVAKNCGNDTINAWVQRLETEIARGTDVYSNAELDKLQRELAEAHKLQKIYNNQFPPVAL